jgi:hypothetical protein
MRCTQLQDWLRELTAYPTPAKIASYLREELAAVDAAGPDAANSSPRRHLRRCERCLERVRRALKYWSLLALFCRDVTPGPSLERRVREKIAASIGARRPLPVAAAAPTGGRAASPEEERLYKETAEAIPVVGWILTIAGPRRGMDFTLAPGENAIGTDEEWALVLDDPSVAPRHCSIVCAVSASGVTYYLLDHGAKGVPGTFVNGGDEPVTWARLEDNDVIRVGEVRLKFKALAGIPTEAR